MPIINHGKLIPAYSTDEPIRSAGGFVIPRRDGLAVVDAPVVAAAAGGPLILDEFTDTDATALSAHTIAPTNTPATSWTDILLLSGGINAGSTITSNSAYVGTLQCGAVVDAGVSDCTITCDWTPETVGSLRGRMVFRYASTGNAWCVTMNKVGGALLLHEMTADSQIERASVSFTWVGDQTYSIKVVLSGDDFEIFVDDVSKITHNSAVHNTATKHGIGMLSGGVTMAWDNFTVTA